MIAYPAMLDVPAELVTFLAELLAARVLPGLLDQPVRHLLLAGVRVGAGRQQLGGRPVLGSPTFPIA